MAEQFAEQVAVVTGGAQGLGRAITEMLIINGCSVVVFDIIDSGESVCAEIQSQAGGFMCKCTSPLPLPFSSSLFSNLVVCVFLSFFSISCLIPSQAGNDLCKCIFTKVDISDEGSVSKGFEKVRANFSRLDIMVNCAGIVGPNGVKSEDVSTADFDKVYAGKKYTCLPP